MSECTDRLGSLLNHFPVRTRMFHSGAMCGITDFPAPQGGGQIHLVRSGELEVVYPGRAPQRVSVPSLLLYPRPTSRRFVTDSQCGAVLVCAELQFDGGDSNPVSTALPDVICIALDDIEGANQVLTLLFDEAFGNNCGRHVLIDRLFEVVLIQVLRHLMETGQVNGGLMAGLSHPRLRKALVAMHERPGYEWTLDALAGISVMSRTAFADSFRKIVGCTPGAYLQAWRIRLAQQGLRQGRQMKAIAIDVGYGSEAALSRAFKAQCGLTSREWRNVALSDSSDAR